MADDSNMHLWNANQAAEYLKESVRLGVTVNGGAAVAIIAFLGARDGVPNATYIQTALLCFCVGVGLSFLAALIGHFTHGCFASLINQHHRGQNGGSAAYIWATAGIVCIIFSIVMFIIGVTVTGRALFS